MDIKRKLKKKFTPKLFFACLTVLSGLLLIMLHFHLGYEGFCFSAALMFPTGIGFKESVLKRTPEKNIRMKKSYLRTEDKLQGSFLHFFDKLPAAVEIFDCNRRLIWINNRAKEKWYFSKGLLSEEKEIRIQEHPEDSTFNSLIGKAYQGEIQIYSGIDYHYGKQADGETENIEAFILPISQENLKESGILIICPVTDKGCIANLIRQNDITQTKSFLSNISHEFRTPLNWMLGFSELIERENDIKKIRELNKNIRYGGKVLLSLMNKLIEMSSLSRNEAIIEKQEFSLAKLLVETVSILNNENKILESRISVYYMVSLNNSGEDLLILSDQRKLKQVLTCLTHNAMKFTSAGFIEIGCRELPDGVLLFHVKDTGTGISEDIQHYIFEIFRKEKPYSSFLKNGRGLGLTLAKSYVSLLGGNIWVQSESGRGTTFFFTIKNQMKNDEKIADEPIPGSRDKKVFSLKDAWLNLLNNKKRHYENISLI